MSKTHTVQQGETLHRIAKKYGFTSTDAIYQHSDNAEFRARRPDPNLLFPGDQVVIPDKEKKVVTRSAAASHTFKLKRPATEKFRVKIQNAGGKPWQGKRVVLQIGDDVVDATVGADGVIEADLPSGDESCGELRVFMQPNTDKPTHVFEVQLGHLDPVEELSGVQARCNALGFDCGPADGIMGGKTRAGVKKFQAANGLDVDGVPGPLTKEKLKKIYGC